MSCAKELLRRLRFGGGEVLGGVAEICAAESLLPPKRCLMVDSHSLKENQTVIIDNCCFEVKFLMQKHVIF